ncbi:MAG TPA: sensor histidine kinase, partial [Actinomycetales bacterium]|nr:sensor histidine kinase [Actinomycetales bacterium]
RSGDEVRLDVVDDGRGFDTAERAGRTGGVRGGPGTGGLRGAGGGYGLTALRERLVLLGGSLEVESEPGEGTAVSLTLPLRVAEDGT